MSNEVEEYNKNLEKQIAETFEKVCKQNNLQQIFETEIVCYYPKAVYEKNSGLEALIDYFRNI